MAKVLAVAAQARHGFSKTPRAAIEILAGQGVRDDAHAGVMVRHLYDRRRNPDRPNLRQVHLLMGEVFDDLVPDILAPGSLGENITTIGIDLCSLPQGARLRIGASAVLELTGLREPCVKIDRLRSSLRNVMSWRLPTGEIAMKGGVMAVAIADGVIAPGDAIAVSLPMASHQPMRCV
jgi:hypothetical protein